MARLYSFIFYLLSFNYLLHNAITLHVANLHEVQAFAQAFDINLICVFNKQNLLADSVEDCDILNVIAFNMQDIAHWVRIHLGLSRNLIDTKQGFIDVNRYCDIIIVRYDANGRLFPASFNIWIKTYMNCEIFARFYSIRQFRIIQA